MMSYITKIQMIQRAKGANQYYINFPSACAQMMSFEKGEEVEWILTENGDLFLKRSGKLKAKNEKEGDKLCKKI